jgi:D-3-phosphoglycerate dehydrogenase
MFAIWFERALPDEFRYLLDGSVRAIGAAASEGEDPLASLSEADAIVAAARQRYDGTLMDRAPRLKVIARTGVGYDNVCLADATARGICVCNTPDAPTISTAEHAVALMLAVVKRLKRAEAELRAGSRIEYLNMHNALEVYGRRLGLVGLGRIGSRVALLAQGLGMQVSAYDPYVSAERAAELGIELVPTLEELLREADVVSLHAPLTPETRHLINARTLAWCKRGAYLVNAARGGLVDEQALLAALESGQLAGAGLDVFDPEPPSPDHPLLGRDDVVATPHVASATAAGRRRLWEGALVQVLQVLRGERPPHLLNPESWPPRRGEPRL